MVIGLGGGAVINSGKAVAALVVNPQPPLHYLEVVGAGHPLERPSVPYIAIPTTAGTGAEVTRNAVLAVPEKRVKVSLRSPFLLPRLAVVDPQLTLSLPPALTASTGMDALTQVLEPFVCNAPTPLTNALCRDGIALAGQCLLLAYTQGEFPGGAPGHVAGQPVRRHGAGQRQAGRRARAGWPARRHVPRPARRSVCPPAAAGDPRQPACIAIPPAGFPRP